MRHHQTPTTHRGERPHHHHKTGPGADIRWYVDGHHDQDWRVDALCRQAPNPEIFFPDSRRPKDQVRALEYCSACPVTAECLAYALTYDCEWGIWGGLTQDEHHPPMRRNRRHETERCQTPQEGSPA